MQATHPTDGCELACLLENNTRRAHLYIGEARPAMIPLATRQQFRCLERLRFGLLYR